MTRQLFSSGRNHQSPPMLSHLVWLKIWVITAILSWALRLSSMPEQAVASTLALSNRPSNPILLVPKDKNPPYPGNKPSTVTVKRRYVFPIQPADVAHYVEFHHDYPATDILAPADTAFVAVTDGVIEEVSAVDTWRAANDNVCNRGGLSVSLVGTDGVRYYGSHLAKINSGIRAGVRVKAGHLLGLVGASGNARGTAPHVHFGISRPTGAGDCIARRGEISPFAYLNQWRKGEDVTPKLP